MGQWRSCYNGTRLFPDNVSQIDFRDWSAFQMLDIVKWSRETEMAAKYKETLRISKKSEVLFAVNSVGVFNTVWVRDKAEKQIIVSERHGNVKVYWEMSQNKIKIGLKEVLFSVCPCKCKRMESGQNGWWTRKENSKKNKKHNTFAHRILGQNNTKNTRNKVWLKEVFIL